MTSRKPVGLSISMHRQPSLDHNLPFVRSPLGSPMVLSASPPSPPPFLSSSESASSIESFASDASVEADGAKEGGSEGWRQRGQQLVLNSAWQGQQLGGEGEVKETPPQTPACTSGGFDFGLQGGLGVGLGVGGGGFMRRQLLRRNSSMSATSSVEDESDEDDQNSWTEEEKLLLQQTFDSYLDSAATTEAPIPKFGPPPPNLTHIVAKAVVAQPAPKPARSPTLSRNSNSPIISSPSSLGPEAAERPKWRHGMRSTRAQILSLVKERQTVGAGVEATPKAGEATPRGGGAPSMARANSMDFLPMSLPGGRVGAAARLGARLQEGTGVAEPSATAGPPNAGVTNPTLRRPMFASMARTNSLSSIAGSPSQPASRPAKAAPKASRAPPSAAAAAAFSAFHLAPHPASTTMARSGSDCGPSVERLDRLPALAGSYSSPEVPKWSFPAAADSAGLVMPGPSHTRRSSVFEASAKQPVGAGLGLEAAFTAPPPGHKRTTSGSARKRLATGTGLGAPVAVDARGGGSPTPPVPGALMQGKMLFPDLVVTEHDDGAEDEEAPVRSMKSLSLHPTVPSDEEGYFGLRLA